MEDIAQRLNIPVEDVTKRDANAAVIHGSMFLPVELILCVLN